MFEKTRAKCREMTEVYRYNKAMLVVADALLTLCDELEAELLPELTDEERAAMNSLPPDFIDRLLRGERVITRNTCRCQCATPLTGSWPSS